PLRDKRRRHSLVHLRWIAARAGIWRARNLLLQNGAKHDAAPTRSARVSSKDFHMTILLHQSQRIIEAAFGRGAELNLKPLSVAVVDSGGHLVAFQRQDSAS